MLFLDWPELTSIAFKTPITYNYTLSLSFWFYLILMKTPFLNPQWIVCESNTSIYKWGARAKKACNRKTKFPNLLILEHLKNCFIESPK